jgi:hypothetical protein
MSPNRVFDRSFDIVRKDPEVLRRYGDNVKAYGRDHGGHREGRRNFIEHTNVSFFDIVLFFFFYVYGYLFYIVYSLTIICFYSLF